MHLVEHVLIKRGKPLWIYYPRGLTLPLIAKDIRALSGVAQLYGLLETLQVPERLYEWAKDAETVGESRVESQP